MSNKSITFQDKEKIKQALAKGKTYREALLDTSVASTRTVGKIAKESVTEIKQLRETYLQLIEKNKAGMNDRAKLWADMTRATKLINDKETPDWLNRREALVYIDQIAGLSKDNLGINLIQINLSPEIQELAQ